MAEYIVMPKLGFDMREGVLVKWLKEKGQPVKKGEVVAEIESDKATLELEAHTEGTLLAFLQEAGNVVPVGANMAIVGAAGEDVSGLLGGTSAPAKPAEKPAETVASAPTSATAVTPAPATNTAVSSEYPGGIKATPVARRMAQEKSVNLTAVTGTGPDGRIRKADIAAFLSQPTAVSSPAVSRTPVPTGPETTEVPTTRLRQAIARRMVESKTTVPHFYVTSEIDMAPSMALRQQLNALLPDDQKISVNDMVVKAAGLALRQFPNINASFAGDKLVRHNLINVGSAMSVEGGLLTIVQHNTDTTPLAQVAADHRAMIARVRNNKAQPDDMSGSTFTVSNLGAYDVDNFIAIVNPPDAAILAVGSARQVPVVVNGQLAVGTRMKVTLSADHRVTDGVEAARYLQAVKAILEQPLKLLL